MRRFPRSAAALGAAVFSTGCFGTPTPLAPAVTGSVGAPHHGVLTDAIELPTAGPGFVRYRVNGTHHWGNPRLVHAVMAAAKTVHDEMPGGAPMIIGDLSGPDGGKIPHHQSHRTGRDIDLPWFVTTPGGVPLQNPGFVPVGPDGLARLEVMGGYVRLDVPREWRLVRALITSKEIDVQWMFCSLDVEALIIDYARALGEPPDIVWHAETVLMQPGDSLVHDDHIHMRIACTPDEMVFGCEGGGPRWEWLPPAPSLEATDEAIYEAAEEDPLRVTLEEPQNAPPG
ncbi:MAG TPA: penicillin-insensitive murein endopeptidase [Polyangiaceae bacterium]|jgi:penicillin-insensitive murein endopeptidase|nr:penicillin-insensitive murein endopeptidase [Polyangiaceae bacterium]